MATGGISAATLLHSALSKPVYQRCLDIRKLLEETGNKELHLILPPLIENIFGFGNQNGWGIGRLSKNYSYDFNAIRDLLHPHGPLLQAVQELTAEPFRYEFPCQCLPFPVQRLLEEGSIPPQYADNVQLNPNGRPYSMLSLNAFEYYFYHFAYFLVNPQKQKTVPWTNPTEALYTVLVEEYLNYFLPPDGRPAPGAPHSDGSITNTRMHTPHRGSSIVDDISLRQRKLSMNQTLLQSQPVASPYGSYLGSPTRGMTTGRESVVQETMMSPQFGSFLGSLPLGMRPGVEPVVEETSRSQVLLQILVDFWLHQTSLELDKYAYMTPSTESLLPSGDHIRVVRMLIKHLHYFVNSVQADVILSPYSQQMTNSLDIFKRSVFPQIVKKKLYGFLKHSFERWPLDASFRLILETWLSYIQPWRYTNPSQSNREKEPDSKEKVVDDKWCQFIVENLLFYSVLFHCFLQRINRTELSAPRNAYIVFRVTKVFSLPNLQNIIEDADTALFESVHQTMPQRQSINQDSYLSQTSRRHRNVANVLTNQILELEGAGFKYVPLFSEDSVMLVYQLLESIAQAKESAAVNSISNDSSKSFWRSLLDMDSVDYNTSRYDGYDDSGDMKKVEGHLTLATNNLCQIFQLEPPATKGVTWGNVSRSDATTPRVPPPDVDMTEEGPQVGPLARYQLMNGLRKFKIEYQGDPDLQLIRSYECAWLVRSLHYVATHINTRFGRDIAVLYDRNDFAGRFSRLFLSKPTSSPADKLALSPSTRLKQQQYQTAHLSLRWLATYHMIAFIIVLYLLSYFLLGTGPVGFILLGVCVTLGTACFKAAISS